jgi:hypothetical protein
VPEMSNPSPAGAEPVAGVPDQDVAAARVSALPQGRAFYVGQQDFVQDLMLITTSSPYAVRLYQYSLCKLKITLL